MAAGDTLLVFTALMNEYPSANAATFDLRNGHPVLDFDGAASEEAIFSAVMPQHYAGGGVVVYIHYAVGGIAGDIDWDAEFERIGDQQQDIDGDSFAAPQSTDGTAVPGTTGLVDIVNIAFTDGVQMDLVAVGESFRLKITRIGGDDTNNDDAQLVKVEIREAS
jgi:hypothetical protein